MWFSNVATLTGKNLRSLSYSQLATLLLLPSMFAVVLLRLEDRPSLTKGISKAKLNINDILNGTEGIDDKWKLMDFAKMDHQLRSEFFFYPKSKETSRVIEHLKTGFPTVKDHVYMEDSISDIIANPALSKSINPVIIKFTKGAAGYEVVHRMNLHLYRNNFYDTVNNLDKVAFDSEASFIIDAMLKKSIIAIERNKDLKLEVLTHHISWRDVIHESATDLAGESLASKSKTVMAASIMAAVVFVLNLYIPLSKMVEEKRKGTLNLVLQLNVSQGAFVMSYFATFLLVTLLASCVAVVLKITVPSINDTMNAVSVVDFGIGVFMAQLAAVTMGIFLSSLLSAPSRVNLFVGAIILGSIITVSTMSIPVPPKQQSSWVVFGWFKTSLASGFLALLMTHGLVPFMALPRIFENPASVHLMKVLLEKLEHDEDNFSKQAAVTIKEFLEAYANEKSLIPVLPILGVLFYLFLAWYFYYVGGDADSVSKKPYFFFLSPSFWSGKPIPRPQAVDGDTHALLREKSKRDQSVIVHKLSKSYKGSASAVKEISLTMEKGHCYAILGQNGAGKTTLIKMLTGGAYPTNGQAYIFGDDLTNDNIFPHIAICYQEDILWEQLTPAQHIHLYCSLLGTQCSKELIENYLDAVGLLKVVNKKVGAFSGGMKRRLSVVLSLISDRPIVFLDEPTTGMDPINRRKVWSIVQKLKDKIVVLTTHSMEEAEALGDHIVILNRGTVKASGNPLFLKSHFRQGYQITVSASNPDLIGCVETLVRAKIPSATILSKSANIRVISIPKHQFPRVPAFLRELQTLIGDEWTLSDTTLEQVFLSLCHMEKEVIDEEAGNQMAKRCILCFKEMPESVALYTHKGTEVVLDDIICGYCAEVKDYSHAQPSTDDFCDLTGQLASNNSSSSANETTQNAIAMPQDSGLKKSPNSRSFSSSVLAVAKKTWDFEKRKKKTNCGLITVIVIFLSIIFSFLASFSHIPRRNIYFRATQVSGPKISKSVFVRDMTSGFDDCQADRPVTDGVCMPMGDYTSRGLNNPYGLDIPEDDSNTTLYLNADDHRIALILGKKLKRKDVIETPIVETLAKERFSSAGLVIKDSIKLITERRDMVGPYFSTVLDVMLELENVPLKTRVFNSQIHMQRKDPTAFVFDAIIAGLVCALLFFPVPRIIEIINIEKNEKLVFLMRLSGLKPLEYWVGNFIAHATVMICVTTLLYGVGGAISWFDSDMNSAVMGFLLYLTAFTTVSIGYFLGTLIKQRAAASFIGYTLIMNSLTTVIFYGASQSHGSLSYGVAFLPLAFMQVFLTASSDDTLTMNNFWIPMGVILLTGLVSFFAAYLIMMKQLTPEKKEKRAKKSKKDGSHEHGAGRAALDEDVVAEAEQVLNGQKSPQSQAVYLKNLVKSFDGEKNVLDQVSLGINYGECFGLLGPNGAGKTTLITILMGMLSPSSGECHVAGVKPDHMGKLTQVLGVCPQFDALWPDLTVEEHLQLYTAIRGVPKNLRTAHVQQMAELVELDGDAFTRLASNLSGGMKRRLSIAIALIGSPKVVFLDEPTTGVDPQSRQLVWKIIDQVKAKGDQSIVVTTHSMEEADALCTRIGILAGGNFRCIGTQTRLKSRFASGLSLNLLLEVTQPTDMATSTANKISAENELIKHLCSVICAKIPNARIKRDTEAGGKVRSSTTTNKDGTSSWRLTTKLVLFDVNTIELLSAMEELSGYKCVLEWSLNPTSLEDVFVKLTMGLTESD